MCFLKPEADSLVQLVANKVVEATCDPLVILGEVWVTLLQRNNRNNKAFVCRMLQHLHRLVLDQHRHHPRKSINAVRCMITRVEVASSSILIW